MTINSIDSNIPIEIAKGGTNSTSMTTNGVVYYNGTSLVTTAAGTASQTLTSNGAGNAPSFKAAPAGNLQFLASQTASGSATIPFTSVISNSYSTYFILISNALAAVQGTIIDMQVSTNNGGSWIGGTDYNSNCNANASTTNTWVNNNISAGSVFQISSQLDISGLAYSGAFYFYNVTNGNVPMYQGYCSFNDFSGSLGLSWGAIVGYMSTTTNVNAIRFFMSTGNLATGKFTIFGVKES